MARSRRVQLRRRVSAVALVLAVTIAAVLVAAHAELLFRPVGTDVTNPEIKGSAELPVVFWCMGWPIALVHRTFRAAVPLFWALGCVMMWLHIAIAFHLGHGWSHAAAWQHTQQIGGYGDGIFVNYAFALVWLADVVWAWVSPASYVRRPWWLNWTIHGFLAFVVFNAAVVFGGRDSQINFATYFGGSLLVVLFFEWRNRTRGKRSNTE